MSAYLRCSAYKRVYTIGRLMYCNCIWKRRWRPKLALTSSDLNTMCFPNTILGVRECLRDVPRNLRLVIWSRVGRARGYNIIPKSVIIVPLDTTTQCKILPKLRAVRSITRGQNSLQRPIELVVEPCSNVASIKHSDIPQPD